MGVGLFMDLAQMLSKILFLSAYFCRVLHLAMKTSLPQKQRSKTATQPPPPQTPRFLQLNANAYTNEDAAGHDGRNHGVDDSLLHHVAAVAAVMG